MNNIQKEICLEEMNESTRAQDPDSDKLIKSQLLLKKHRQHFFILAIFSLGAAMAYLLIALQKQDLYFSECPNCVIAYFSDLYLFILTMLGVILVSLINFQTKLGEPGEPPIVFFNKKENITILLGFENALTFIALFIQGYFCSTILSLHARNLLLMKLTTFYVHFFIGMAYFKRIFRSAVANRAHKLYYENQNKIDIIIFPSEDKEMRSENGVVDANSARDKNTIKLEESDKSSVSKFSELDFNRLDTFTTTSADEKKIRAINHKSKRINNK